MDKELKELILSKDRYNDFIILDNPVLFKDLFKDKDYDVVQVHDTTLFSYENGEKDIVGFSGVFEWKNNTIKSLDYDTYSEDMEILGYCEFLNEETNVNKGLDILW